MKHYRWRSVDGTPTGPYRADWYFDVWIQADGSLHNPHGYPEELARAAVLKADARKSEWLERGVRTRRKNQEERIRKTARRVLDKARCCGCCAKYLRDAEPIARGICSTCWPHLLKEVVTKMMKAADVTEMPADEFRMPYDDFHLPYEDFEIPHGNVPF